MTTKSSKSVTKQTTNLSHSQLYNKVISTLLCKLNTPYALGLYLRHKYGVVGAVSGPNPCDYWTANSYLEDAQAYACVSKGLYLKVEDLPADVAVEKFFDAELSCKLTNITFARRNFSFRETSLLERARAICYRIIGNEPDLSKMMLSFGPGSTSKLRGQDSNLITKLSSLPETTPRAYETVVKYILTYMPHYALSSGMVIRDRTSVRLAETLATTVNYDEFLTVPKNYKTDRGIQIAPSGNMLVQKAYGNLIRDAMRRFGYDLNVAEAKHSHYARIGSIDGSYATIDLQSASDTISREFVKYLLPQAWYDALDIVRVDKVQMGPSVLRLEKFSAMGNGFTWELESLLFLCLALAARDEAGELDKACSVFGDDIICGPKTANVLLPLLTVCGFTLNKDKTFTEGPFRESCGNDYFRGISVRPIYIEKKTDEITLCFYYYLNRITALASAYNFGLGHSRCFRSLWIDLIQRLPADKRCGGPSALGDIVIHGWQEIRRGGRLKTLKRKSRYFKRFSTSCHELACALYGIPSEGVIPRTSKYTVVTQWLPYIREKPYILYWC